jgi:hypothetical protein
MGTGDPWGEAFLRSSENQVRAYRLFEMLLNCFQIDVRIQFSSCTAGQTYGGPTV